MTVERRRTQIVYEVILDLVEQGRKTFRPGDVNSRLRTEGEPMGTWEVRAEFSKLAEEGVIKVDPKTAWWKFVKKRKTKAVRTKRKAG